MNSVVKEPVIYDADSAIRIFQNDTESRRKLELAAFVMTFKSPHHYHYRVEDTFFDYGQGWMWTTIVCHNGDDSWQAINPGMQADLLNKKSIFDCKQIFDNYFDTCRLDRKIS